MKEAAAGNSEDSTWLHVSEAAGVAEQGTVSQGERDRETEVSRVSRAGKEFRFHFQRLKAREKLELIYVFPFYF